MNPLNLLEPDERERYEYLKKIWQRDFEDTFVLFHLNGIVVSELLNLLSMCAFLFDEFSFPEKDHQPLLYQALQDATKQYLACFIPQTKISI